jgi:hypothetical protein
MRAISGASEHRFSACRGASGRRQRSHVREKPAAAPAACAWLCGEVARQHAYLGARRPCELLDGPNDRVDQAALDLAICLLDAGFGGELLLGETTRFAQRDEVGCQCELDEGAQLRDGGGALGVGLCYATRFARTSPTRAPTPRPFASLPDTPTSARRPSTPLSARHASWTSSTNVRTATAPSHEPPSSARLVTEVVPRGYAVTARSTCARHGPPRASAALEQQLTLGKDRM